MNNIVMTKKTEDKEIDWMYLDIECFSNLVVAKISCMTSNSEIDENIKSIDVYLSNSGKSEVVIGFGLGVNPNIEIKILRIDQNGHLKLEINLDVDDSDRDSDIHKCIFFIETELGLLEQFKEKLKLMSNCNIGESISLV